MAGKLTVYRGHESARMAELEGAPLASFHARAAAFAIDMTIASMSFVVPAVLGAMIFVKMGWIGHNVHITFDPFHHEHWESVIWYVVFIAACNYIGNGATIGKKAMGIRAVSLVHHRLSLWHSAERALGYGASALEAFFGFFQYFLDPNRQTVHDRIAKTIVVSERKRKVAALSESARVEQNTNEPQVEAAAPEAAEDRVAPA